MRINDLVSQCTSWKIRTLRDVEELITCRADKCAIEKRPELTEDSEKRRLSASVGSADDDIHARLDFNVHRFDELVSIRSDDRQVNEFNVIFIAFSHSLLQFDLAASRRMAGLLAILFTAFDQISLVASFVEIFKGIADFCDNRCVTSELLDFLV